MKVTIKILLSTVLICLILQKVLSVDSSDEGFEETSPPESIEKTKDTNSGNSNFQHSESEIYIQKQSEQKSDIGTFDTQKNDAKDFNLSYTDELTMITCLSAYSKIATQDRETFTSKLENLFAKSGIFSDAEKVKVIEKYVINAIMSCEKIVGKFNDFQKRQILTDLYHETLSIENLYAYLEFDDNIISRNNHRLNAFELLMQQKISFIQQKRKTDAPNSTLENKDNWWVETWGNIWIYMVLTTILISM